MSNTRIWCAPWIDLEDPDDNYEEEWLVEWITKHARYDGLICCHINVHKLHLDKTTEDRVFERLGDDGFLDYTGFNLVIKEFEETHQGAEIEFRGRSGTHVCLNESVTDLANYGLDELIELYERVHAFDFMMQDACRAAIHWVNTYEIVNGHCQRRDLDSCEECGGVGYLFRGLSPGRCMECNRYHTQADAERAVYPHEAIQVVICYNCREPFGQVEHIMQCPKCQAIQRVP